MLIALDSSLHLYLDVHYVNVPLFLLLNIICCYIINSSYVSPQNNTVFRMIDSAQAYNEEHVGAALEESSVPREEIFIVSKVHPRFLGYEETVRSIEESLKNLKVWTVAFFLGVLSFLLGIQSESLGIVVWRGLEETGKKGGE